MTTLLSRLQSATEPSRELDDEIAMLVKAVPDGMERYGIGWWHGPGGQWHTPRYTESTDAALTLVPPTLRWHVERDGLGFIGLIWHPASLESKMGESQATPAIAVLIAIIRHYGGEFEGF
jgi:hypothetical protein